MRDVLDNVVRFARGEAVQHRLGLVEIVLRHSAANLPLTPSRGAKGLGATLGRKDRVCST